MEQLQQQLAEPRAELDREHARFEQEQREQMAGWHQAVATHEEKLRALNDQIHDLQTTNEGLRKELADQAARMEVEQGLSRNTTLEFEKLVKVAWDERDAALTRQREAEESVKKSWQAAKKNEDSRDQFKNKADVLAAELSKANSKLKLGLEELEKVDRKSVV